MQLFDQRSTESLFENKGKKWGHVECRLNCFDGQVSQPDLSH